MKKIVILNGSNSAKKNTAKIVKAFTQGAESVGNEVKEFMITKMNIHSCLGCIACFKIRKDNPHICVQVDDMEQIYSAILDADVIVFASPMYWWGISGQLKIVVDRLEAVIGHLGIENVHKKSTALLMTNTGGGNHAAETWYSLFKELLGCRDLGSIISLGAEQTEEAQVLGKSIT
jgi:multimeric flavodoxin WrbA